MTLLLHFENAFPDVFEKTVSAFKSGARELANSIVMELIFALKKQNEELKKLVVKMEKEPEFSLALDNEEFHDNIVNLQKMLERLSVISHANKEKSEIFNEMDKITTEMYENLFIFQTELSFIASELRHKENSALAS